MSTIAEDMPSTCDLPALTELMRRRRATRHFVTDPLPEGVLEQLLECANWAPSGYNLQPTHYFLVDDVPLRRALSAAAFGQSQIVEAPATIVFCGDRRCAGANFERVIADGVAAGVLSKEYERKLRSLVPLMFATGPLGLGWLWKATAMPVARLFAPVPSFPAVDMRLWLAKQAMLSAMNFMLAASAAGLATCPMEGFDESRVRRVLGIDPRYDIFLIVPVGYPAEGYPKSAPRFPVAEKLHRVGV